MIQMSQCQEKPGYAKFASDDGFRDRDRLLSVPGMTFDHRLKMFVAPLTWAVCCAARGVFGEQLELGQDVIDWAILERTGRIDPALELRLQLQAPGDERLYPFQRAGVEYLASTRKTMLLDDMGTGKTIQTIMALDKLRKEGETVFPAIVVGPNNMKLTWLAEFKKWLPDVSVAVLSGSAVVKRKIIGEGHDVLITNWEAIRTLSRLDGKVSRARLKRCYVCTPTLAKVPLNAQSKCEWCKRPLNDIAWRTVILDEAHRMKDNNSKQARAACALRTDATAFRFALTGTIIGDKPVDMWPVLHFIEPTWFASRTKYIERYCRTWYNYWGALEILGLSDQNRDEFFQVVDPLFRRMQKEVVLPFLPPKQYSTRTIPMEAKQAKAYHQIETEMLAELETGHLVVTNELTKLVRLSQFSAAYGEADEDGHVTLTMPSNKVDALLEILDECERDSVLVFAESRQLIELASKALEKAKIGHGLIVGGQTEGQRDIVMQNFQDGTTRVVLATIKAGGTGITLTRAKVVIFLQRSWSMIENTQAEARAHRIGSKHEFIQIIDVLSEGTFESAQQQAIAGKQENLQEVVRDAFFIPKLKG